MGWGGVGSCNTVRRREQEKELQPHLTRFEMNGFHLRPVMNTLESTWYYLVGNVRVIDPAPVAADSGPSRALYPHL